MDVLVFLARNAGEVRTKDEILDAVWAGTFVAEAALSRRISELRTILGDDAKEPRFIETIPKRGYRLIAAVSGMESVLEAREPTPPQLPALEEFKGEAAHAAPESAPARWHLVVPWILVGLVGVVFAISQWRRPLDTNREAPTPARVSIVLSEPLALASAAPLGLARPSVTISPDGDRLVYVAERDGVRKLFLREMDRYETTPIDGTEGGFYPVFSPDGEWVAFFTEGELKKVSVIGGEPAALCEARNPVGATWEMDDTIFFADGEGTRLSRVSAAGGDLEVVYNEGWVYWPQILPTGDRILYTTPRGSSTSPSRFTVAVLFLDSGESRILFQGGTHARYVATGHIVFSREGTLLAVPFDLERLELTGPEVPVLEGVRTEAAPGAAQFAFSDGGSLAYVPGTDASRGRLVWIEPGGAKESLPFPPQSYGTFELSPDGRRLAVTVMRATDNVWVYDLDRGIETRLTVEGNSSHPVWTPDGRWVTFYRLKDGDVGIFRKPPDGAGEADSLAAPAYFPWSWSPDGATLAFDMWDSETREDIWLLTGPEGGDLKPLIVTRFNEWGAAFSPDGNWMAYVSDESGRYEVYMKSTVQTGESDRTKLSTDGGEEPRWSPRGDELFYRNGRQWMAVSVTGDVEVGPRLVFEGDFMNVPGFSYDVTGDGRRFLLIEELDPTPPRQINVVLSFFEELKALAYGEN